MRSVHTLTYMSYMFEVSHFRVYHMLAPIAWTLYHIPSFMTHIEVGLLDRCMQLVSMSCTFVLLVESSVFVGKRSIVVYVAWKCRSGGNRSFIAMLCMIMLRCLGSVIATPLPMVHSRVNRHKRWWVWTCSSILGSNLDVTTSTKFLRVAAFEFQWLGQVGCSCSKSKVQH